MNEKQVIEQIKLLFAINGKPNYLSLRFSFKDTDGKAKEAYLRLEA